MAQYYAAFRAKTDGERKPWQRWEGAGRDYVSIAAGALDLPTGLVAARHIFVESKGDYYEISDGLEQLSGSMVNARPL